jgi:hypothetical protein
MKKPDLRIAAALAAILLCLTVFSLTAYASGGDYYADELPVETSEPTETPAPETTPEAAFTPEGSLSLIDDLPETGGKQFLTVETKGGNYFYIIIDRAADSENVYFLNEVDEADLLALMDEPESEPEPAPVCTCKEKCYAGHVDTSCPVCATNMSECTGKEKKAEPTAAPEVTEKEPEKKQRKVNPTILLILLLAVGGGAAYYFLKVRGKAKPKTKGGTDLNDYDFGAADDDEYEFEKYDPEEDAGQPEEAEDKDD